MRTIKQYQENEKALEENFADTEKAEKELRDKLQKVSSEYSDIMNNIRKEEYAEKAKIRDKGENKLNPLKDKKKSLLEVKKEYKRLMGIFSVMKKNERLDSPLVYRFENREEHFYTPLEVLVDDKYKKFNVYIVGNKKPKNCYSLVLVGNTIFNTDILPLENCYGVSIHSKHSNVLKCLKDASSREELETYFNRVKDKLISSLKEQFTSVEKEFTEVVEMGKQKPWKIAHVEYQLDDYENCYSRGTEMPEYKALKKQLKKLNAK